MASFNGNTMHRDRIPMILASDYNLGIRGRRYKERHFFKVIHLGRTATELDQIFFVDSFMHVEPVAGAKMEVNGLYDGNQPPPRYLRYMNRGAPYTNAQGELC